MAETITMAHFASQVAQRSQPGAAMNLGPGQNPETVTLEHATGRVAVRLAGGYMTAELLGVSLDLGEESGNADAPEEGEYPFTKVFYGDLTDPRYRIDASHDMAPVGPSTELGGQHGFPRWTDRRIRTDQEAYRALWSPLELRQDGVTRLALEAVTPPNYWQLLTGYALGKGGLEITTQWTNNSVEAKQISVGGHYYLQTNGDVTDAELIDGRTGREAEIDWDKVQAGEAQLWEDYDGQALAILPGGRMLSLQTQVTLSKGVAQLPIPVDAPKLMAWHRAGTRSLCLEPTAGFDGVDPEGNILNSGLYMPIGAVATMRHTVQVVG